MNSILWLEDKINVHQYYKKYWACRCFLYVFIKTVCNNIIIVFYCHERSVYVLVKYIMILYAISAVHITCVYIFRNKSWKIVQKLKMTRTTIPLVQIIWRAYRPSLSYFIYGVKALVPLFVYTDSYAKRLRVYKIIYMEKMMLKHNNVTSQKLPSHVTRVYYLYPL